MPISKTEAAAILNCRTSEAAQEVYEQRLFEWKQKYLMLIPPIKVIGAHIQKIHRLNEAAGHFILLEDNDVQGPNPILQSLSLLDFLEAHQAEILRLKLAISSTENGKSLVLLLDQLTQAQMALVNKLALYCPPNGINHLKAVKISDASDLYAAQKELKEKDIPETEIMNYLSNELKFGSYPFNSYLLNEVLKSLKQIN